jgi:ATP-binding cassette, subfamily B (MDR/TAP), member 1
VIASGSSQGNAGTVYAVVFLILDASFVISQFGPFIQTFALAAAAGSNVFQFLDHPESHINVYSPEGLRASRDIFNSDICFHSVNFVYPARPTLRVLEGLNLKIKPARFVGVAGVSGSGKSTLSSLLQRLYDHISGKITMGSRNIKDFNVSSWRSHISIVNQDPVLFSGTVLSNIKHGLTQNHDPEPVKREKCIKAAKDANAWDFIKLLPDGIDTQIGDSGETQLSGGQKQRICLARALVGDPALLILDEFTSALDSEPESAVLDALSKERAKSGLRLIMIAHRLATIKGADSIIVMAHGYLF